MTKAQRREYCRKWNKENQAWVRAYREKTKTHRNKRRRELYRRDEWRRTQACAQARAYAKAHPTAKKRDNIKRYGLTLEAFNALLISQGHRCAICGQKPAHKIFPFVDHCHRTGKVRGLLCINCNHGIGKFQDNTKLLEKAVAYLNGSFGAV